MTQNAPLRIATAAEWKNVAKATRRRRRILQAGFFHSFKHKPRLFSYPRVLTAMQCCNDVRDRYLWSGCEARELGEGCV